MVSAPPKPQPLTCPKPMGEYLSRRPCGKKVKGQTDAGEWLCGGHLGAYNRVKRNDAERNAQWEISKEARQRLQRICDEMKERYGLQAAPTGHNGMYADNIIVNVSELLALLETLRMIGK